MLARVPNCFSKSVDLPSKQSQEITTSMHLLDKAVEGGRGLMQTLRVQATHIADPIVEGDNAANVKKH